MKHQKQILKDYLQYLEIHARSHSPIPQMLIVYIPSSPQPPLSFNSQQLESLLEKSDYRNFIQKQIGHSLDKVSKTLLVSKDKIIQKINQNFYITLHDLKKDILKMINYQLLNATSIEQIYQANLIFNGLASNEKEVEFNKRFQESRINHFKKMFKNYIQFKIHTQQWPVVPKMFRQYQVIEDFEHQPPDRIQIIEQIRKSNKTPIQCGLQCSCITKQQYCTFDLILSKWNSECPNRKQNIECNHLQKEANDKCKNTQIKNKRRLKCKLYKKYQNGQSKQQNKEQFHVEQSVTWGLDYYTQNLIISLLPQFQGKQNFVQKSLLKAINLQRINGYKITDAYDFIIANSKPKSQVQQKKYLFNNLARKCAKYLLKINPIIQPEILKIHTKGLGAICITENGIKKSSFVIQYFGQIYQAWRWFQRQDFTKKFMKHMGKKDMPDFYNIVLQRHRDDPAGFNLLYVDPISKGNFASRFSHSCTPNCGTITTISNGRYYIGMYALKDIEYGEQLTFDYCSLTESKQEQRQAICLCGSKRCRGTYLDLSTAKHLNVVLDHQMCFLNRNKILFQVLFFYKASNEEMNQQQIEILKKWNIWQSLMKDSPIWLRKWAALNLYFVQSQKALYLQQIKKCIYKTKKNKDQLLSQQQQLYVQAKKNDLLQIRFMNLVTSVIKLEYYLNSIKHNEAPLKKLSDEQVVNNLWLKQQLPKFKKNGDKKNLSIIQQLLELVSKERFFENVMQIVKKWHQVFITSQRKLTVIRKAMLQLSIFFRKLFRSNQKYTKLHLQAIADILFMYAFTYTYFTNIQYPQHNSPQMSIHYAEIGNFSQKYCEERKSKSFKNQLFTQSKPYASQYIWGQTVAWFKQTVATPQASLSQDRRGTLSYPTFSSFKYTNFNSTSSKSFPFQKNNRKQFLKVIKTRSYASWPPDGCSWSYKNSQKMYGTIFFQNFIISEYKLNLICQSMKIQLKNKNKFVELLIQFIDEKQEEQRRLFEQIQTCLHQIDMDFFKNSKEEPMIEKEIIILQMQQAKIRKMQKLIKQ